MNVTVVPVGLFQPGQFPQCGFFNLLLSSRNCVVMEVVNISAVQNGSL